MERVASQELSVIIDDEESYTPEKLTWNPKMEVWKMIFLFKQVIFRFHVNFPGCMYLLCISCDLVERFPRRPGILKLNNVLNKNTPAIGWHLQAHGTSVST